MRIARNYWELLILDGREGPTTLVGEIDGDGRPEIVSEHTWYRPATSERGTIPGGIDLNCVGATTGDIDGDGRDEVFGAVRRDADGREYYTLYWYKPGDDLSKPWAGGRICPEQIGHPHDLFIADVDGDGRNELVVVRMYIATPGVYIYKPGDDMSAEWEEHVIHQGTSGDGTVVADFDGDGIMEIVAGPYLYKSPSTGPFSGPWSQTDLATGFREMGKSAMTDITGNGRPDVILAESEYPDCRVSWFENRTVEDPETPWIEHPLDDGFTFVHSLDAGRDEDGGAFIFLAEMEQGGWNAPYNHEARLVQYTTADLGATWDREVIYKGCGAFQAVARDLYGDGRPEIVGTGGMVDGNYGIHIWRKADAPAFPIRYRHRFLDRKKPYTGTDILAVDVDGDGRQDVICAGFWYRNPTWERREVPGIYQIINACDLDHDGRMEFIGTKKKAGHEGNWYGGLTSEMYWLRPIDPLNGHWEEHYIGTSEPGEGSHGWPHGSCIAPVLPDGKLAFIVQGSGPLELYEVPDNPTQTPWPKRPFPEGERGETRMIPHDLTGNGLLDLVASWKWLENRGDGTFTPHEIAELFDEETCPDGLRGGEQAIADIDGDGHADVIICEEYTDYSADPRRVHFARLAWLRNPGDPRKTPWEMHIIDQIRSPHSLAVADLDGDGQLEIVCGEHDPFNPYRSRPRLYIYKKADPSGLAWTRHTIDERFDHHVGGRLIELDSGRIGIISHAWQESAYLHLWEPE